MQIVVSRVNSLGERYYELHDGAVVIAGPLGPYTTATRAAYALLVSAGIDQADYTDAFGDDVTIEYPCGCTNPDITEHLSCRACPPSECYEQLCEDCTKCESHCACTHCNACHARVDVCSNCGNCYDNGCCECNSCQNCDRRGDFSTCEECSHCATCCECNLAYGGAFTADSPNDRKIFNCTRTVGVEWEYNSVDDEDDMLAWGKKWRAGNHEDGSCGREVVTAPIAGDHLVRCIQSLGSQLAESNAKADDTCGIHVHVYAGDLRWADMYRLLYVYSRVEGLMYLMGGQHRAANTYAVPCGKAYAEALRSIDRKGVILGTAYDRTASEGRRHSRAKAGKKDGGRYKGLNICPWLVGRRGHKPLPDTTVEFRIHRNSLDAERVLGWAQVCARLVEWCATHSDAETAALPKSSLRALIQIAGADVAPYIMKRVRQWRKATNWTGSKPRRRISTVKGWVLA